jgi:uncharacterized protein
MRYGFLATRKETTMGAVSLFLLGASLASGPVLPPVDVLVLQGAMRQVEIGARYTPGYFRIGFPMGDLPKDQGVCTDVVIRALRFAGIDLQRLIHEDMRRRFSTYPRREGRPDSNIDHRRVPNQIHFLRTIADSLPTSLDPEHLGEWKAGDLVYWKLPSGLDHAGVVSAGRNARGEPLVVHNLGRCREEDVIGAWTIVEHLRIRE